MPTDDRPIRRIVFEPTGEVRPVRNGEFVVDHTGEFMQIRGYTTGSFPIYAPRFEYENDPITLPPEVRMALSRAAEERYAFPDSKKYFEVFFAVRIEDIAKQLGIPAWNWRKDLKEPEKEKVEATANLASLVESCATYKDACRLLADVILSQNRRLSALEGRG